MSKQRYRGRDRPFFTERRPHYAAVLLLFAMSAHAVTTLGPSSATQTVSTDTSYLINPGTAITTSSGNAINVEGIAPVTMSNAGSIISSTDNIAAAVVFDVPGSLVNQVSGAALGHTHGILFNNNGAANNIVNRGDVSARISHAITYLGAASGTVDNFGTLNANSAVTASTDGILLGSTGNVTVNNHAGAVIRSGMGDQDNGSGILVSAGTAVIHNDGLIDAYHEGILGRSGLPMEVRNGATGVIRSTIGAGVRLQSGSTLDNAGVIASGSETAILLFGPNNVVTLGAGSRLISGNGNAITSQSTDNSIILTGTNTESGNFFASPEHGFVRLNPRAGSDWTLNGTVLMGGTSSAALDVEGALTLGGAVIQNGGGTTVRSSGSLTLGTGGAAGIVTGNVVNDGLLRFNRSDAFSFDGAITGTGTLVQAGSGTAALTAAGSSQGAVNVQAGTLALNQPGAFNAGSYATQPGATTAIAADSTLNVATKFSQAPGAALTIAIGQAQPIITAASASLGGALNVSGFGASAPDSASALTSTRFDIIHTSGGIAGDFASVGFGGTASPVDYLTLAGAKTNNGLDYEVGFGLRWLAGAAQGDGAFTLAGAADTFNADVALNDQTGRFASGWDGRTLTKKGAGTLILSAANGYTGATLIDAGTLAAGARDVIAGSSQLAVAAGATFDLRGFDQHVSDLAGAGNVTLAGGALSVNSAADSTFSGTIGGAGSLTKSGAATLTLSGDNTFTGTTTIASGALRLGAGGTTGSVAGNVVDDGALVFDRADNVIFRNTISGTGDVVQQGSGVVTLTNAQTYSGATRVDAGALVLTDGARLANTSQVSVAPSATFGGYGSVGGAVLNNGVLAIADAAPGFAGGPAGQFLIGGALTNNGEIRMASAAPASTLTVAGDYTGNNGRMALSTVLAGDGSATDRLVVHGGTAGQTRVAIANAGGAGAQTANGIEIVQVDGQSNGVFTLDGRVVAGPYEYSLRQGGLATPDDGDWYLRSAPTPRPEPGAYLGNQRSAETMFTMTLHDRAGFADSYAALPPDADNATAWARTRGAHTDSDAASGRIGESTDTALVQAGIDLLHRVSDGHRWQAGVMAGYGSSTTDATAQNSSATARGNVNGASAGVYATWRGNAWSADGPYVDTWLQYAHFDNTVKGADLPGENYSSSVWAGSLEGGWAFALGQTSTGPVLVEPQLQLIYTNYHAGDHVEHNGTVIHSDDGGGFTTRVGVRIFHAPGSAASPGWLPFAEINWWHDTQLSSVSFNDVRVSQDGPRNRMEFKLGAQGQIAKQWRVWGNLGYQQGDGGYRSYEGLLGARYIW
ncbi:MULTISPECIES: autotransporter outer membrane beta-barrel domain-containing protein [unclassified Caballeronia]|uniref:autotransporter outer membrane beta-barrel domain-containing protein n=1 Tax=unclassified Caballeronia TaxID=2646786 RepID=UPI002027748A|nr:MULTISPECIES: autotransporter outer membrane beta-barrel domain-containing protein [unclassified Caballeronia]